MLFDEIGPNDAALDRTFEVGNNTIHVRKEDPYGFWKCSYERGTIPEDLGGYFTSFAEAEKAVLVYLDKRKREIKSSVRN